MAQKQKIPRLICYDIADPKRLARVHRYISTLAMKIQHSVYYCLADATEIQQILTELKTLIDPKRDDIRIYPLPLYAKIDIIGPNIFDKGIMLLAKDIGIDFQSSK